MSEALANGWGSSAPLDDTLVRAGVESLASRIVNMARANNRAVLRDERWTASALADAGLFSAAGVLTAPPSEWSWLAPALRDLAPPGQTGVVFSPFPTPDLTSDGLVLVGHPPFMVRPAGGRPPPSVPGLHIRPVEDAGTLQVFERTFAQAYPAEGADAEHGMFAPGYLDSSSRAYLGLLDGQPVATAATHIAASVNHVEFVATQPWARGRGIGAAMTWAATVADPSLPAVLVASDDGRGVYESLGYLPVTRWTLWLSHSEATGPG